MIFINKLIIKLNPNLNMDDEELSYKSIRCARLYEQEKGETKSVKVAWQDDRAVVVYNKGFKDAIIYSYEKKGE